MELKSKDLFMSVLKDLVSINEKYNNTNESTKNLLDAVENMPLLVPIVGEFSAGKSSLLNSCMGKNILSVGMAPETAKPAELYYSEKEYNESVDKNGNITPLESIDHLPQDCVCVRRYINSDFLKNIEPLVLVDMPGFDSPHDEHNMAIFNYLDKGTHYVVLTPCDAGTVSRSMSKQITNFNSFGMDCSFFISKCDLRSDLEIKNVKATLESHLESLIGGRIVISQIGKNDVAQFYTFVEKLNPDEIFHKLFVDKVLDELYCVRGALNTKISALQKDKRHNEQAIEELQAALKKVEKKRESLINEETSRDYSYEAQNIAEAVGRKISSQVDSLVDLAISGGENALTAEIDSLVQSVVVPQIQTVIQNVSVRLTTEISKEVTSLKEIFSNYGEPDILQKIQEKAKGAFEKGKSSIDAYIRGKRSGTQSKALTVVLGGLAIATNILAPIVEVILLVLPSVLEFVFDKVRKQRQKEEVRSSILGQIPTIKQTIRKKVTEVLKENSKIIIEQISAQFDDELKSKEKEIQSVIEESKNNQDSEQQIALYQEAVVAVDDLIKQLV